ncbi:MAG TPA: DUF1501 domain-containing protein [Bryobacteraceae bacterium]|nr:DUF1501 domain-containing protein [Bryobacteraceae bacterium]
MTRRQMLQTMGTGLGAVGLSQLLASTSSPGIPTHFAPRAKHVIFLFLNGGPSQVDTFDPKPMLTKFHGKPMPQANFKTERKTGNLLASPFQFKHYGQSGIEVSDIFSKVGECIDDVCVIRSMHTDRPNHEPSLFMMNTGATLPGRPSMGSWLTYGLGSENHNLPGYLVLCPGFPVIGPQLWSSAFLPATHQGTHIANKDVEASKLIPYIHNSSYKNEDQRRQLDLLGRLQQVSSPVAGDPQVEASIQSMETAFRMQTEAPEIFDITKEKPELRARYGDSDFGRGCLMAVRLIEKGVRMVQVYYGNDQPWDNHDDIMIHRKLAHNADAPIAALLQDLKARGLLKETLVIVSGEFGRTPVMEVSGLVKVQNGRDHNNHGFSTLLAGGGVKGGITYGATDDFGFKAVDKPVHPHDLHATILHLFGYDHTRLTYRYSGRDFRLTDVEGTVIRDVLA